MGFKRSSNDSQWGRSIAVQWVSDSYRPLNGYSWPQEALENRSPVAVNPYANEDLHASTGAVEGVLQSCPNTLMQ